MFAFFTSIIGVVLFLMGDLYWYVDYQSQPALTVNITAMAALIALEGEAENYCSVSCSGGAIPVAPPVPGSSGTYGAINFNNEIITWYSANVPGAETAVLDPALIHNVAATSVVGRFYAATNTIVGASGMILSTGQAIVPNVETIEPGSGIPDLAIVLRSHL